MLDLLPAQRSLIAELLEREAADCEILVYGSRVVGKAKPYSDLDIALKGKTAIPMRRFGEILEAFQNSALPFRVDIVDWHRCSPEFQAVIESQGRGLE